MSREHRYATEIEGRPHNPRWNKDKVELPYCDDAQIETRECIAFVLFIFNIFIPGFGTFLSTFFDRKGINLYATLIAFL